MRPRPALDQGASMLRNPSGWIGALTALVQYYLVLLAVRCLRSPPT